MAAGVAVATGTEGVVAGVAVVEGNAVEAVVPAAIGAEVVIVSVAELASPIPYVGSARSVKIAVSGLAPLTLLRAVMGSAADEDPAGMVTVTGMSPWGRR